MNVNESRLVYLGWLIIKLARGGWEVHKPAGPEDAGTCGKLMFYALTPLSAKLTINYLVDEER